MTKVFYFSATGNSFYAAGRIAEALEAELCFIPAFPGGSVEADRVVIVTPEHAIGLPVVTADFIKALKTDAPVYIVLTYGGALMGADRAAYEDAREAGLDVRAVYHVKMVENFTVFFTVPKGHIKRTLKKAPDTVGEIIAKIERGEAEEPKKKKGGRRDSENMRSGWRQMGARLHVNDSCVKCGKCAAICPVGNITMGEEGPVFGGACTACLACYHRCPQKAIVFGKFKKKFRYFCPLADENGMGRRLDKEGE